MQTLEQLRRRAKKHGLTIRKVFRGDDDSYCLVDMRTNAVVSYPTELPLARIEQWLDELDKEDAKE